MRDRLAEALAEEIQRPSKDDHSRPLGLGGLTIFWSGTTWQVSRANRTTTGCSPGWSVAVSKDLATAIAECLGLPTPTPEEDEGVAALDALLGRKKKAKR